MDERVLETWSIHQRIVGFVLAGIPEAHLTDAPKPSGRSVLENFAHIHNVRLMWLKSANPALLEGLTKLEKGSPVTHGELQAHLEASGNAITALIKNALETDGRIKGFKPHAPAFVGYLVAHEFFHLGKADLILRQSGHAMDDKIHFGMWEWGVR